MIDPSPSNLPDPLPAQSRGVNAPQTPQLPAGYITPLHASAPQSYEHRRSEARLRAALARADEDGNAHLHWEALLDAGLLQTPLLDAHPAPASTSEAPSA
jgi:hypothetical protein